MIGKKKKIEKEQKDEEEEQEEELPTPIQEAKIQTKDSLELTAWAFAEYNKAYNGMISADDVKEIDIESTELTLLMAIFSELRIMREIMSQKK